MCITAVIDEGEQEGHGQHREAAAQPAGIRLQLQTVTWDNFLYFLPQLITRWGVCCSCASGQLLLAPFLLLEQALLIPKALHTLYKGVIASPGF